MDNIVNSHPLMFLASVFVFSGVVGAFFVFLQKVTQTMQRTNQKLNVMLGAADDHTKATVILDYIERWECRVPWERIVTYLLARIKDGEMPSQITSEDVRGDRETLKGRLAYIAAGGDNGYPSRR